MKRIGPLSLCQPTTPRGRGVMSKSNWLSFSSHGLLGEVTGSVPFAGARERLEAARPNRSGGAAQPSLSHGPGLSREARKTQTETLRIGGTIVNSHDLAHFSNWSSFSDATADCAPMTPGVYVLRLGSSVARLKGLSDMVYIGFTKNIRNRLRCHLRPRKDIMDVGWAETHAPRLDNRQPPWQSCQPVLTAEECL